MRHRTTAAWLAGTALVAATHIAAAQPDATILMAAHAPVPDRQAARIDVDSAHRVVIVNIRPLTIPAATPYDHHIAFAPVDVSWPVGGWIRGYRIDLVDSTGRVLPREMLHHAGVVNTDRRQLLSPMAERLLAAGKETAALMLPASMGVPMSAGSRLVVYFALVNPADTVVAGVSLRLEVAWTPETEKRVAAVLPLILDAHPVVAAPSVFDAPPGISVRTRDFSLPVGGYIRVLGGHIHDYGVELRLEDAATGKVLARLGADRTADGRVTGVERTRFLLKRKGLRVEANHPYRVVGVYDNTTCSTITGAMAGLAALFVPDDTSRWPVVDASDAVYKADYDWLLASGDSHADHEHGDEHAGHDHMMMMEAPAGMCGRAK